MRLSQLKYLIELKKNRTISETAKKLYISQPSLSAAIKELEEELGFDIIERSNKGVSFTKRGEIVLKYSHDVLQAVNSIERLGKKREQTRKGYLSIASVYYIFQSIVMDVFLELKEQFPDTVVNLREENSYDIVQMLVNKEIDIGIIMISNTEEMTVQQSLQQYGLEFYKMMDEEMYFVVGHKNPLYGIESASMETLLQYPFLTRRKALNQFNENILRYYNKDVAFVQIDESDSFLKYLSSSQAISVMPGCSVKHIVHTSGVDLHPIRATDFNWTSKIGWVYPKDEQFSAEEEIFVELLESKSIEYEKSRISL